MSEYMVLAMNSFEENAEESPLRKLPLVTERARSETKAARWQINLTLVLAIAIVTIFLWGLNNQRGETTSEQTAASQPMPAMPHGTDQQAAQPPSNNQPQQQPPSGSSNPPSTAPSTTGSGSAGSPQPPPPQQNSAQ